MKKITLLLLVCLIMCGCMRGRKEEIPTEDFPCNVGSLRVHYPPEKIAVLSPGLMNILKELALEKSVVAVYSSYESETLIKIGDEYCPDSGKIIESKAEYLLSFTELENKTINKLSENGVRVLVLNTPQTLGSLENLYSEISTLFYGTESGKEKGKAVFSQYYSLLDKAKSFCSGKTYSYIKNRDLEASSGNLSAALLEYAFQSPASTLSLTELNPDFIFLDDSVDLTYLSSLEISEHLSAVLEGNVFGLSSEAFDDLSIASANKLYELITSKDSSEAA